MSRQFDRILPLVTIGGALILWQVIVTIFSVPTYLLPSPIEIINEVVDNASLLAEHSIVTLQGTLLGFALCIGLGLPIAVGIVSSNLFERSVYSILVGSQTVPKVAIAPLFVVWFGFGMTPKVLVAFLIGFFPVVISAVVGLKSVDPESLQLLKSMGATRMQEFRLVRFPNALPSIFGGLKVSVTLCVIGAIVGEFVGSTSGLGNVLLLATGQLDTPLVFASITILTVIGVMLFYIVDGVERRFTSWSPAAGGATITLS